MSMLRFDPLRDVRIPDEARTKGVRVVCEPGDGKTVLLASSFSFPDFQRGIPTVMWDIQGGLIDDHWALVLDQGPRAAEAMSERIRYVDVGNPAYVYGRPFYYWLPGDDAFSVSQRPLEIFIKLSPALKEAPILGQASLLQVGTAAGMLMAIISDGQLGCFQITEAMSLLLHYDKPLWKNVLDQAIPAIPAAVKFFRESYSQWDKETQRNRRWAFESRVWPYLSGRTLRATVGQGRPGIDWSEVVRDGLCVMLDFSHVPDANVRDQMSLLYMQSLTEFIERRGVQAAKPLSLIFDEVPALLENPALEPELRRIINRYRAMKVWPVIAHQSLVQLSPTLRPSAWSFGNQIIGKQLEFEASLEIVRNLLSPDPYRVKWPTIEQERDSMRRNQPDMLPREPHTMPLSEQERELAAWLQRRSGRQFLVRRFYDEQTPDPAVRFIAMTPDVGALRRVSKEAIARAKEENLRRFARPVDEVLQDIDARLPEPVMPRQERPKL